MQIGKLPYNTMIRSIKKVISPRRVEVIRGVGIQNDCSVYDFSDGALVVSTNPALYLDLAEFIPEWIDAAFYRVYNDCLCAGADPVGFEASFFLPESFTEESFRKMITYLEHLCKKENIEYSGGHTQIVPQINKVLSSFTMFGKHTDNTMKKEENLKKRKDKEKLFLPKDGQTIVMTGFAGAEVAALLAKTFYEKLSSRFTEDFLIKSADYLKYLCCSFEAAVARRHGVTAMHNISSGGVLGCLWEMSQAAGLGLTVDLRAIPIRQETIEICNTFDLNPYQISSCGGMLYCTDDPATLLNAFLQENIPAAIIGSFHKEPVKRLLNNEEERFLDRPSKDPVWNIINSNLVEVNHERENIINN